MPKEASKSETPKLPKLDEKDLKAVRSFWPGKILGRTAALLSLVLAVLLFVPAIKLAIKSVDPGIPTWAYWLLIGLCFLAVVAQIIQESIAVRTRHSLQTLAIKQTPKQYGYFRIGPYQNTANDRAKFKRADHAEKHVLDWIKTSNRNLLYLCGDSGSGKSSLLNAFVLPELRGLGWTVVEARAWQNPERSLRDALLKLPELRVRNSKSQKLRSLLSSITKSDSKRALIVIDQFEEFGIIGAPEQQEKFASFIAGLESDPVENLILLLVVRSEYQVLLEEIGLPLLRSRENLFQLGRFLFPAASIFLKESGLGLKPDSVDRLLTSAAELDETPGMVRPITINVIGYVLSSGKAVIPTLDAGALVRSYIERTVEQPVIRDCARPLLEQLITEQGTKRPRSEAQLVADTKLRRAEVRAVLNALDEAGLARNLDENRAEWELSHDFVAHAVGRFLGRQRKQVLRQVGAYAAPSLLVISVFGALIISRNTLTNLVHWYSIEEPYSRAHFQPYVLSSEKVSTLKPGAAFRECANNDCPEMIVVPAGAFMMGSPDTEQGRYISEETPQHPVKITGDFAVSKYDVTLAEWRVCASIGDCASAANNLTAKDAYPAINVSWEDAQRYVAWLSRMTGQAYRLLTESEWEYSARANTTMAYFWGVAVGAGNANCNACGSEWDGKQASPVGSFKPNAFGLYDMAGNVWQWVQDCYVAGYDGAPADGSARIVKNCNQRVVRGGSWISDPRVLRSANRFWYSADNRNDILGFRVARTLPAVAGANEVGPIKTDGTDKSKSK